MRITYDPEEDVLYIEFNESYPVKTDLDKVPGFAVSYDESGKICAVEIEEATKFVAAPNRVDFEYLGSSEIDVLPRPAG
jgi:uncharacterized protein YuzE